MVFFDASLSPSPLAAVNDVGDVKRKRIAKIPQKNLTQCVTATYAQHLFLGQRPAHTTHLWGNGNTPRLSQWSAARRGSYCITRRVVQRLWLVSHPFRGTRRC